GRPKEGANFAWTWRLGMEGDLTTNGIYKKIIPFKELILLWQDHPAGEIELKLEFHSLGEDSSKLVVTNSGYPVGDKYDVWIEAASEGWEEEGKHLREYLKKS
ncbi:SRPBCC domain-containing protein, partial [Leptospira interrogans]